MSVAENLICVDDPQAAEKMAVSRSKVIEQFLLGVSGLEPDSSFYNVISKQRLPDEAALRSIIAKESNPWKVDKPVKVTKMIAPSMRSSFELISEIAENEHQKAREEERARARKMFDPVRYRMEYNMQRAAYFESLLAPLNNPESEDEEPVERRIVEEVMVGDLIEEPLVEDLSEGYNSYVYEAA